MVGVGVSRSTVAPDLLWALRMNTAGSIVGAGALALVLAEAVWLGTPPEPLVPLSKTVGTELKLQVQRKGRSLDLLWDRNLEAAQRSNHARLQINDGIYHSHLDLNNMELSAGRLVYWPETDNVTFRLEVVTPSGRKAATIQLPGVPVQTAEHRGNPTPRKPSPFASRPRLQNVSVQPVSDPDLEPESNAPQISRPTGSFFGRIARKIPVVRRRYQKSTY